MESHTIMKACIRLLLLCCLELATWLRWLLPIMQKTWVWSLSQEDPLEQSVVTHSSILAWRMAWTEEPDGLQSMGSQRVRHNWATNTHTHTHIHSLCCVGFPGGSVVNEVVNACQWRRLRRRRFDPWIGKIPWRRKWQPASVFLLRKSHGQRNLGGYSHQCQTWLSYQACTLRCRHCV